MKPPYGTDVAVPVVEAWIGFSGRRGDLGEELIAEVLVEVQYATVHRVH